MLLYAVPMRLTWPLKGRDAEMRLIEAALSAPDISGIVIGGAAGVGKSRVATEALADAATRGCEVRWVVATSSAREIPLGALASWAGSGGGDGLELVCRVIDSLTASAGATSLIVGVDDVHLLDDLSTFVLQQAVQRRAAKLVLTLREGEAAPVGIQELWRHGHFEWLDLSPLSAESTATLLAASLEGSLDPDTVNRLFQLTRGNVLYLRHIVDQEVADGRLELRSGYWHWSGEPTVPHGLLELIEARIGALRPEVSTVIDVLAIGEPVELAALQRMTDPGAVEEADTLGLISLEQRGRSVEVRVAHPLYGEVRRKRAVPTRLRRLRGLVATELAAAEVRDDVRVLVRRAALSLDSDLAPDGDLLVRAAHGAICLADLPLADRLAEAATRATAGPEAQFIRAHALSWLGQGDSAEQVLAAVAVNELSEDDFARFTYFRASNMLWAMAEPERAKGIIDAASHLTAERARSYVDAIRAVYWFARDRPEASLAAAEDLALDELPPVIGAETSWVLTNIHGDAGRTAAAGAVAAAGQAIVRSSDAPQMRFNIADAHIGALLMSGQVVAALELAADERRQAADLPGAAHLLGIAIAGRTALGAGRLDVAVALLHQASAVLSDSGHALGWGYRYQIPYAVALAMSGSAIEAGEVLSALDRRQRPFRSLHHEIGMARAWATAGQGAVSDGIGILRRTAEASAAQGQFAAEVMCLQTAVQFGDRTCASRLGELTSLVEGPRVQLAARFGHAVHDGDPVQLAAVSDAFEEIGDRVAAADAAAHAAIIYRRDNLRGSSLAAAARADSLVAQCGNLVTPALGAAYSPLPLTDREREIVVLLGHGLPNRDIATQLDLSVRTVENHIYKAMIKTGTTSRDELAALIKPSPLPERP